MCASLFFWPYIDIDINEMNNKKYHNGGTVPNINWKIVERGKIDKYKTHIHDW